MVQGAKLNTSRCTIQSLVNWHVQTNGELTAQAEAFVKPNNIWVNIHYNFPSKIECDLTNGPLGKLLKLLDTEV